MNARGAASYFNEIPRIRNVPQERRERVVPPTFITYIDNTRNAINEVLAVFLDRLASLPDGSTESLHTC